jgi:hypothetical protein
MVSGITIIICFILRASTFVSAVIFYLFTCFVLILVGLPLCCSDSGPKCWTTGVSWVRLVSWLFRLSHSVFAGGWAGGVVSQTAPTL